MADQGPSVSERRQRCGCSAPPHSSSSYGKRLFPGQPPSSGSTLEPTRPRPWPRPRAAERPLPAPHRTLQLPKPKRGALLSAGIWVVVKRLHCLVHELQCWLGSFHGGGGGGDSDDSDTSPRLPSCSASRDSSLSWPQPLPDWRHLLLSGRYQGRGGEGSSWKLPPRKQRIGRLRFPDPLLSCLSARIQSLESGHGFLFLTSRLDLRGLSPHDTNHAANLKQSFTRPEAAAHIP